ncbi:MAG: hypothetical protein P8J87_02985 [Verrucomicrobiales bacterium]|nr:hypothetical protein [Verrucomicrobiales bacterium]
MACETTEKKRPPLPGSGNVDSKAWGRGFPGDAQPGMGGFMPQSR